MLKVEAVNYHTRENAKAHHTDKFEMCHDCDPTPIFRRGQPLDLSVTLNRPFQPEKDIIRIFFRCNGVKNDNPRVMPAKERTTVTPTSKLNNEKDLWSIALVKIDGNTVQVKIRSPQVIAFSTYRLHIHTSLKEKETDVTKWEGKDVYFLFNPWQKGDDVYMADTKMLDEYILNDVGKVYRSSSSGPKGKKWVFGQFSASVLPALKLMMGYSNINFFKRGNPVHLTRELTRMLSSTADGGGVLQGDWSGDYEGGTAPSLWNSSVAIFEDYMKQGCQPVCYGQCWVFSAITVTACRAIGIPCRSVTNYNSAHDTDMSMTIDSYIIPEDVETDKEDNDSVWNFHVWCDAWMSRYDLPEGYGGWQAIDATPQEFDDEGEYQCGPCSLEAVKRGEISYNYEGSFVTSEVNADMIKWVYVDEDTWKPVTIDKKHIGKVVLTKMPFIYDPHGDTDFEDITDQYKSAEGSKEERLSFYNAVKQCSNVDDAYNLKEESKVTFCFSDISTVQCGKQFAVKVSLMNGDTEGKTVELNLTATSIYYNGVKANLIKNEVSTITLAPSDSTKATMIVTADEYSHLLVDFATIKIHCIAKVKEDNFIWAAQDKFSITMPELIIKTAGDLERNEEGKIIFKFKNPLQKDLTRCKIKFEAPGIGRNITVLCRDIKAGDDVSIEHVVKPDTSGEINITASFDSKQLKGISGSADLVVL